MINGWINLLQYILISFQLITQKIPVADTSKQNICNIAGVLYLAVYFIKYVR